MFKPSRRAGLRAGAAAGVLAGTAAFPGAGTFAQGLSRVIEGLSGPEVARSPGRNPDVGALKAWLDRLVARQEAPGAVALIDLPQGRWVAASGWADVPRQRPVTADTRFYIASCGKLATSVAVLQLERRGAFRITDRVLPLLARLPGLDWARLPNMPRLTVEHLLRHRSGLPEYFDEAFENALLRPGARMPSLPDMLAPLMGTEAQAPAGTRHDYCNTNYVVLGHLVASVLQRSYPDALAQLQWQPLQMERTSVGATAGDATAARHYVRGANRRGRGGTAEDAQGAWRDVSPISWLANTGDGAVVTTAADYARFMGALFRDERLLSPGDAARMCKPLSADPSDYGLGCMVERTRSQGPAWGHDGSVSGCTAHTWWVPQRQALLLLLANGDLQAESAEVLNGMLALVPGLK